MIEEQRAAEHEKYHRAYMHEKYRMGGPRKADAQRDLKRIATRGAYLDVGAGRGEMIDFAESIGFAPVHGVEIVPELIDGERVVRGEVHALPFPDKSFAVVTMFDVIEHLIPGDDEAACREMARVATGHILVSANNRPSFNKAGDDLHINRRPYDEWDALFRQWFPGEVIWLNGHQYVSETWQINL